MDSHDWQSYVRLRSVGRFRNDLVRSARNCGPVRWRLAHGRLDDPRPLRNHRDWPRNKPRPNLLYRWILRFLPDQVGRPRFRLGACPDEFSGRPAHRPWHRTVRAVSGHRDLGGPRAFRSLLGRLERQPFLERPLQSIRLWLRVQCVHALGYRIRAHPHRLLPAITALAEQRFAQRKTRLFEQ